MRETGFILECNFRAASSEDTDSQLKLGDLVKINGIIAQPELNGLKGRVTVVTPERIGVKIYDRNTSYSLKPEKLEKIKLAHVPMFDDILNKHIPHITEENRHEVIDNILSKLTESHSVTQYSQFEKMQLENLILCLQTKEYTIEQLKNRLDFQSYMNDSKTVGDVLDFLSNKPSNVKAKEEIILRDFPILGKEPTTKNYRKNYLKAINKYKIPSERSAQLLKVFDERHKQKSKIDGVTPQSLFVLSLAEYMSDDFISS